jgi:hypothetical protein
MGVSDPQLQLKPEVPTWNFFAPLRLIEMEADHRDDTYDTIKHQQHHTSFSQANRPPPSVLTSEVNLIQLQSQLNGLLKGSFEYCNNRNWTRVVTKK